MDLKKFTKKQLEGQVNSLSRALESYKEGYNDLEKALGQSRKETNFVRLQLANIPENSKKRYIKVAEGVVDYRVVPQNPFINNRLAIRIFEKRSHKLVEVFIREKETEPKEDNGINGSTDLISSLGMVGEAVRQANEELEHLTEEEVLHPREEVHHVNGNRLPEEVSNLREGGHYVHDGLEWNFVDAINSITNFSARCEENRQVNESPRARNVECDSVGVGCLTCQSRDACPLVNRESNEDVPF